MKTRKVVWEAAEYACKKQKQWDQFKAYWNQWKHFNGPWTRPSLVKWNGEINGFGRETNLELVEVDGTAVKKKWSGRKERAWAVENQDRGWQPAALEFGKWLKNAKCEICLLVFVACAANKDQKHSSVFPGDFPFLCPLPAVHFLAFWVLFPKYNTFQASLQVANCECGLINSQLLGRTSRNFFFQVNK